MKTVSAMGLTVWIAVATFLCPVAQGENEGAMSMERKDYSAKPFKRMVILGESTVQGGGWVSDHSERYADILVELINSYQEEPMEYINKGIGASVISPKSPGYEASSKPSAIERYKEAVIAQTPDLFVLAYGLNDMRAGMDPDAFKDEMAKIIRDVKAACHPVIVLVNVYHMTGFTSYPPFDKGSLNDTNVYNGIIRELAEENDCLLADVWEAEGQADWLINPDGVHANALGNRLIANRIFEVLAQNCSGLSVKTQKRDADTKWARDTTRIRYQKVEPVGENKKDRAK
ncbi:MAG TPA: GDSL-type esterase/lipase family protein [bacterium]|nr:GDSL-type esterase/lipase family protein [bacterium]HPO08006.1 GDSL-type esterase/lipase family protein [bacterium]HQO35299.1 GDSL-type esterase/lipase family protein [bacterium]HQQ00554.1 GDSL-type esterase/lipase family protein [bacterium]